MESLLHGMCYKVTRSGSFILTSLFQSPPTFSATSKFLGGDGVLSRQPPLPPLRENDGWMQEMH